MTTIGLCMTALACQRGMYPENPSTIDPGEKPKPDITTEIIYVGQCRTMELDFALPDGAKVTSEQAIIKKINSIPQANSGTTYIDFIPIKSGDGVITVTKNGKRLTRKHFTGILPDIVPDKSIYHLNNAVRTTGIELNYELQINGERLQYSNEFKENLFMTSICDKYLNVGIEPAGEEAIENGIFIDRLTRKLTVEKEIEHEIHISDAIKFSYLYQENSNREFFSSVELSKGEILPLCIKASIDGNPIELSNIFYSEGLKLGIHQSTKKEDDFMITNNKTSGPCTFSNSTEINSKIMVSSPEHAMNILRDNQLRMFFLSAPLQTNEYYLLINGKKTIYDQYIPEQNLDGILVSDYITEKDIKPVYQNDRIKFFVLDVQSTLKRNPYFNQSQWLGPVCTSISSVQKDKKKDKKYGVSVQFENIYNKPFTYLLKYKILKSEDRFISIPGHPDGGIDVTMGISYEQKFEENKCLSQNTYRFIPAYHSTYNNSPIDSAKVTILYGRHQKEYAFKIN